MKNYHATPIFALARGKVRYVGEPVVGVVAESRYQAEDALELIAIDYEPLPVVIDPEAAVRPGAPLLHEEAGTNVLVAREFKRGDADAAFAAAPVRVAGRFRMHRKTPVAIEPRACLAEYDAGRDALTLHSATQVPGIVARCAGGGARYAGPAHARHRARCRRRFWRQGLALSGRDFRLRRGAAARPRRSNGPATAWKTSSPTARALTKSSMPNWRSIATAASSRLRADVIGDVGAYSIYPWTAALEPVQVVSFLPGPYRIATLSRPGARRRDVESADSVPIAASAGRSRPSSWNG